MAAVIEYNCVMASTTRDRIISLMANLEHIIAATADKGVTAGTGVDRIVAAIALKQLMIATAAVDDVIAGYRR